MPIPPPPHPAREQRLDIQALRGFAVLAVLLYHARLGLFPAGYLGVDVFFVISGFLITGLIRKGIEQGGFHFSRFYFRRAKRLLPAAYVTFLVTALSAPFFLGASELKDFLAQMVGAVTFTANIVLWQQSGYFAGAAELKPLLHVWSLAIEEQYYFLLPATLAFVPRRYWLPGAVVVLATSIALAVLFHSHAEAAFYLLPTRAWELTLGSIGALLPPSPRIAAILRAAFWPALATLLVLPLSPIGGYHPGADALLICLATLAIILRGHPRASAGRVVGGFAWVGDISYSLYLVHWPLFAFFNNVWLGRPGEQPLAIRLGLLAASVALAYLLNRHVEEPMRRADFGYSVPLLLGTLMSSLGLVVAVAGMARAFDDGKDYASIRRVNFGFGEACEFTRDFQPIPACRNSDKPELLVWGDSYAMHLVPGLLGDRAGAPALIQATRSSCAPLLGLARVKGAAYDRAWAESCIRFNDSVLEYLKGADSVKVVVLSSPFSQVLDPGEQLLRRTRDDPAGSVVATRREWVVAGLRDTVRAARALGKRVVVVAPPPSSGSDGFDVSRCTERLERRLPTLGAPVECRLSRERYHEAKRDVLAFLAELPTRAGVTVIGFDDYLCEGSLCRTYIDDTFIYRDEGHLSHEGAVLVANETRLLERIRRLAR